MDFGHDQLAFVLFVLSRGKRKLGNSDFYTSPRFNETGTFVWEQVHVVTYCDNSRGLSNTNQPHESRREGEGEHNRQPVFFTRLTTPSNFVQKLTMMWTHIVQSLTVRHSKHKWQNRSDYGFAKEYS